MIGWEFEFYNENGKCSKLGINEIQFLTEKVSLKKVFLSPYIFLHFVQNMSLLGCLLFLKGTFKTLVLRKNPFSPGERPIFLTELIGFTPIKIICISDSIRICLSCERDFEKIFSQAIVVFPTNQYKLSRKAAKNKIIIDAGANVGTFSLYAAKLGAKKVYAFEPVKNTFDILKKNIVLNKVEGTVQPINLALGDKAGDALISFVSAGDEGASIEFFDGSKHTQNVIVTTVDKFMASKEKVDLIKMDVEGYEAKVIKGSAKTLKKFKPVLCFSAYYKPGDKEFLPRVVRAIRKDYICRLENHGNSVFSDIFFCK